MKDDSVVMAPGDLTLPCKTYNLHDAASKSLH